MLLEIPDEFAAGAFLRDAAAVLREDRDARAEQGAAHRRDQRHAAHQLEDFRRVGFAGPGFGAAQQRIAAGHRTIGSEVLRAAGPRRDVDAAARESWARIFGLQPVHHRFDAVDVLVCDVVLFAEACGDVDMSDVVAGG